MRWEFNEACPFFFLDARSLVPQASSPEVKYVHCAMLVQHECKITPIVASTANTLYSAEVFRVCKALLPWIKHKDIYEPLWSPISSRILFARMATWLLQRCWQAINPLLFFLSSTCHSGEVVFASAGYISISESSSFCRLQSSTYVHVLGASPPSQLIRVGSWILLADLKNHLLSSLKFDFSLPVPTSLPISVNLQNWVNFSSTYSIVFLEYQLSIQNNLWGQG